MHSRRVEWTILNPSGRPPRELKKTRTNFLNNKNSKYMISVQIIVLFRKFTILILYNSKEENNSFKNLTNG